MPDPLADSYDFCRKFARRTAKNFYYSFMGLPRDRFRAMCVLYSYMRVCDDIGDDESVAARVRIGHLECWKQIVDSSLSRSGTIAEGEPAAESPHVRIGLRVLPALREIVRQYGIPLQYLFDVIAGVGMDQNGPSADELPSNKLTCRYQTFDELDNYCYHVAGAVGLCCIHVWGFHDDRAIERAIACGTAFQLTNILRDLGDDANAGRVYLPADDLDRFSYSPEDIRLRINDDRFQALMEFETQRAKQYYDQARGLFGMLDPVGQPILQAMMKIYGGLLNEIERRRYDVYTTRISLPTWQKLIIAADAMVRRRIRRQKSTT